MSASPGHSSPSPTAVSRARVVNRTPSPSPSECWALKQTSLFGHAGPLLQKEKLLTMKYLRYYAIGVLAITIYSIFIIYHVQIVHTIQPAVNWMHGLPFGWLIPIAIFFVISFPPLFGREVLAMVCGLVWGLWVGFGITAAGTMLGEIGSFYAFRYLFHERAEEEEKRSIFYGCLAKVVREGGFKVVVIFRYSAIPGHFTTAIFAVYRMNLIVLVLAALLSVPKQLGTIYVGALLESPSHSSFRSKSQMLSHALGAITVIVTVAAMFVVQREVNRAMPDFIYARRKARQVESNGDVLHQHSGTNGSTEDAVFNPNVSDVGLNTPLACSDAPYDSPYQQWDKDGRAVGYAPDPRVLAPQPHRVNTSFDAPFVAPTGSAAGTPPPHLESTDTARCELQTNAADEQQFPVHTIPEPDLPVEPVSNPFENATETIIPPRGLPPARGGYAFSAPQHSFGGNSGNQPPRASSPSPPGHRS